MAKYPVNCACGRIQQVSGGDSGGRLSCECGETIDVPDLRTLRLSVGEATASPELVIEALLRDDEVPGDPSCVVCGAATEEVCHIRVECDCCIEVSKTKPKENYEKIYFNSIEK